MTDIPHTTHEIAGLLEALADDQQDLDLARRFRELAKEVERHGGYRLRADAAAIQSELYATLEDHIDAIKQAIASQTDVIHDVYLIAQSNQQRHNTADELRAGDSQTIVGMAALVEQIRGRVIDIGADLAQRPTPSEITNIMAQYAREVDMLHDHERRLKDHEQRITDLEGANEGEAGG